MGIAVIMRTAGDYRFTRTEKGEVLWDVRSLRAMMDDCIIPSVSIVYTQGEVTEFTGPPLFGDVKTTSFVSTATVSSLYSGAESASISVLLERLSAVGEIAPATVFASSQEDVDTATELDGIGSATLIISGHASPIAVNGNWEIVTVGAGPSVIVGADVKCVRALDGARIHSCGTTRLHGYGFGYRLLARDRCRVYAIGDGEVVVDGEADCYAYGRNAVVLRGHAVAHIRGHCTATLSDYAFAVLAGGGTHAVLGGRSRAVVKADTSCEAAGYSTVYEDGGTVAAGANVPVYSSGKGQIAGGIVIPTRSPSNLSEALKAARTPVESGQAVVYKAVSGDWTTGEDYGKPTKWAVGETVACDDWKEYPDMGHGLHFSLTPADAVGYVPDILTCHLLACAINVDDAVYIEGVGQVKAPSCTVLHELTVAGSPAC